MTRGLLHNIKVRVHAGNLLTTKRSVQFVLLASAGRLTLKIYNREDTVITKFLKKIRYSSAKIICKGLFCVVFSNLSV